MRHAAESITERNEAAGQAADAPLSLIGGGSRSATWARILSDVMGRTVQVVDEGTGAQGPALGAAMHARMGCGDASGAGAGSEHGHGHGTSVTDGDGHERRRDEGNEKGAGYAAMAQLVPKRAAYHPDARRAELYEDLFHTYRRLYPALKPLFAERGQRSG